MNRTEIAPFLLSAAALALATAVVISLIVAAVAFLFADDGVSAAFSPALVLAYVVFSILLGLGVMSWFMIRRGPELTVIVAYFIQPTGTVGGQADELIDLASHERYENRLRHELGLPDAQVRLFREGQWGMPPIATKRDLDQQEVFTQFVGHAAIALDRLEVADELVTHFSQAQFEVLSLPTSGRVILFQAITAPRYQFGRLLE